MPSLYTGANLANNSTGCTFNNKTEKTKQKSLNPDYYGCTSNIFHLNQLILQDFNYEICIIDNYYGCTGPHNPRPGFVPVYIYVRLEGKGETKLYIKIKYFKHCIYNRLTNIYLYVNLNMIFDPQSLNILLAKITHTNHPNTPCSASNYYPTCKTGCYN